MEKEYFGLQYTDKNGDHLWVNLRNPLHEQLPQASIRPIVEMRVKYFVSPQKLMQPITRWRLSLECHLCLYYALGDVSSLWSSLD